MSYRILFTIPFCLLLLAQTAASPQGAFANLYQVAVDMTNNPGPNYVEDDDSFPYPTGIEAAWDQSIAARGDELTSADKQTLVDCAAPLKSAIDIAERGYRIEIAPLKNKTPPASPAEAAARAKAIAAAKKEAAAMYAQAKQKIAGCADANRLATEALRTPDSQTRQLGTDQSVTKPPDLQGQTYNDGYGETLPAMVGETQIDGERFRMITMPGRKVGQAFEGPVQGAFGTTVFGKATGVYLSNRQVQITGLWDKSGKPINVKFPITIPMKPR